MPFLNLASRNLQSYGALHQLNKEGIGGLRYAECGGYLSLNFLVEIKGSKAGSLSTSGAAK